MYSSNIAGVSIRKWERKTFNNLSTIEYVENLIEGESVGFTVKSMEKDFPISNYPLEQTEFLYDSKQGKVDFSHRLAFLCFFLLVSRENQSEST